MTPNNPRLADAERAYNADPSNEAAARALIRAFLAEERRDEAVQVGLCLLLHLDAQNRLPESATQNLIQSLPPLPQTAASSRILPRRRLVAACAALSLLGVSGYTSRRQSDEGERSRLAQRQYLRQEGNVLVEKATQLYQSGDYDQAYLAAQKAHEQYLRSESLLADGQLCLIMGQIFEAWGKFDTAAQWIFEGIAKIKAHGSPLEAANALHVSAELGIKLGRFGQAQRENDTSLQIRRDAGDEAGVIECLRERGTILAETGEYALADSAWQDAMERTRKADKPEMLASLEMLRGYWANRRGDSSNTMLQSAWEYWRKTGHFNWQAWVRLRQAEMDLLYGNSDQAQRKLDFTRNLFEQTKNQTGMADCRALQGRIALKNNDVKRAEHELTAAVTFYESAGLLPRAARAYFYLEEFYCQQRNAEAVREHRNRQEEIVKQTRIRLVSGFIE